MSPEPRETAKKSDAERISCPKRLTFAEKTDEEDAYAIHGEQGSDAVELGRENLEHDKREAELAETSPHVCALKGTLGCTDLDHLIFRQLHRAGAMVMQMVVILGMTSLGRWISKVTTRT